MGKIPFFQSFRIQLLPYRQQDLTGELSVGKRLSDQPALYILDAGDIDPRPFLKRAPALLLDNRHFSRAILEKEQKADQSYEMLFKASFYDALPHPATKLETMLKQALLSPQLAELKKKRPNSWQGRALIYSGNLKTAFNLKELLQQLLKAKLLNKILWIGSKTEQRIDAGSHTNSGTGSHTSSGTGSHTNSGTGSHTSSDTEIEYHTRMGRRRFLRELVVADMVFTYPGMTLLEAWYLGKETVLLTMESKIHNKLANYLAKESGMKLLEPRQSTSQMVAEIAKLSKQKRREKSYTNREQQESSRPGEQRSCAGQMDQIGGKKTAPSPHCGGYALLIDKLRELLSNS